MQNTKKQITKKRDYLQENIFNISNSPPNKFFLKLRLPRKPC